MGVTGACCLITVVRFAHSMLNCSAASGMLRDLRSQVVAMWWPGCEGLWHRSSTSCSSSSEGGRESLRRQRTETCGHPWSLVAVVVDRSSITGATVSEAEDHAQGTRGFDGRGTRVVAGEAVESLREHDLWQFRNVEAFWLLSAGVDAIRIPDRCGLDRFVQPNRTACADSGDQDFDRGRECPRRLPLG